MIIAYDPATGRITGYAESTIGGMAFISVNEMPADFSPRKYVVKDKALAVDPAWVEPVVE